MASTTPDNTNDPSTSPPTPITPSAVLDRLRNTKHSHFLGDPNLAAKAKFHIGGIREGNILIGKNDDIEPTEFLLCGAFEIDKRNFYLVSDGNYFPNNTYGTKLANVKANCRLLPIRRDPSFKFSIDSHATAISNIQAIEHMAPIGKGDSVTSILHPTSDGTNPTNSIKITHSLFEANLPENSSTETDKTPSEEEIYTIANWPVAERCQAALDDIVNTHSVNPIPAYDIDHEPINPEEYTQKLSGALVEAHFAIVHHQIKSTKRSVFTTVLRKMIILRPPLAPVHNPMKHKLATGPPTEKKPKRGKAL